MDDSKEVEKMLVCGQCNKQVAEANFALHETHCQRFLCLCPDCEEPVPREQLDQHREDQHTQVMCSKCKQKVERCQLMHHESEDCEARLQCCEFCQLEVPWSSLAEHSLVCGSRTEQCSDCGRYVTLKDQAEHTLNCPQPVSSPPLAKREPLVVCKTCMKTFTPETIDAHQLSCNLYEDDEAEAEDHFQSQKENASFDLRDSLKSVSFFGPAQKRGGGDGDKDKIGTCPFCHLALPLLTLRWHEAKCHVYVSLK